MDSNRLHPYPTYYLIFGNIIYNYIRRRNQVLLANSAIGQTLGFSVHSRVQPTPSLSDLPTVNDNTTKKAYLVQSCDRD